MREDRQENLYRTIAPFLLLAFVLVPIVVFTIWKDLDIAMAITITIGFVFVSFWKPFLGICAIILIHAFTLVSTETITLPEVLEAALFFSLMLGWFFNKVLIKRERVIWNFTQLALLLFIGYSILSLFLAIAQDVSFLFWARRLFPFLFYLIIFPIVDQTVTKRHLMVLVGSFLVLTLYVGLRNLLNARQGAMLLLQLSLYSKESYVFRQAFCEPFFFAVPVISLGLLPYLKRKLSRIFLVVLIIFSLTVLAITLSRGYWIAFITSLVALLLITPRKQRISLLAQGLIFSVLILIGVQFVFGNLGSLVMRNLSYRLQTLYSVGESFSFAQRLYETKAVLSHLKDNPLVGYGLGATFEYRGPGLEFIEKDYIHNAYLWIWHSLGLVGLFLYLTFFVGMMRRGYLLSKGLEQLSQQALARGIVSVLVGMMVVSITSPQFVQKNAILVIVLGIGILETLRRWKYQQ